jgi:hypothetical protein
MGQKRWYSLPHTTQPATVRKLALWLWVSELWHAAFLVLNAMIVANLMTYMEEPARTYDDRKLDYILLIMEPFRDFHL